MVCFRLQGGDVGGYAARLSSLPIIFGLNELCIPLFFGGEGDWWSRLESFRGFMHSVFNVTENKALWGSSSCTCCFWQANVFCTAGTGSVAP